MEAQSVYFPSLFWPSNLGQSNFSRLEESGPCAITRLAEEILGEGRKHDLHTGDGLGFKTITCVEIMKHHMGGFHQVSKVHYKTVTEIWERTQQGVPGLSIKKTVPAICILLSKDPLDAQEPGYQPPQTLRVPTEDGERGLRMLLQPALGPPAKFTAEKACPDYWTACPPHSGEISANE